MGSLKFRQLDIDGANGEFQVTYTYCLSSFDPDYIP